MENVHPDQARSESGRPLTGRFAPTPSGRMHLGNLFAAMLAWASVRSRGGRNVYQRIAVVRHAFERFLQGLPGVKRLKGSRGIRFTPKKAGEKDDRK